MNEPKNLWGGRFVGKPDEQFTVFNRSFGFDRKLFAADVRASLAHCEGLRGAGVLSGQEAERIKNCLHTILKRAATDANYFDELPAEDVHSFIEARLVQLIGDDGRKWRQRFVSGCVMKRMLSRISCAGRRRLCSNRQRLTARLCFRATRTCNARSRYFGRTGVWRISRCWRVTASVWWKCGDAST